MRDIQALFYDTGVGKEWYSRIGQGRIEEILSSKGDERRAALEEAATGCGAAAGAMTTTEPLEPAPAEAMFSEL